MKPANPGPSADSRVARDMTTETRIGSPMATKPAKPGQPRGKTPDTFTVGGNRLHLLETGAGRLEALIGMIDGAKSSLRLLYYI